MIQHLQSFAPMEWAISETVELPASEERTKELKRQTVAANEAHFEFLSLKRVIALEGTPRVKECTDELDHLLRDYCVSLERAADGDKDAPRQLKFIYDKGDEALQRFILEAGRALHSM